MKKLKVGVLGCGRGAGVAQNFKLLGCEVVATCDNRDNRAENAAKDLGEHVKAYKDFDTFITHGFDILIVANDFHEHAPYILRAMEKNIHVYSECVLNGTMAEGVQLVRASKTSQSIVMLAENYPHMLVCSEMRRVYQGGTLGKVLYAEGEYNHPIDPIFHKGYWKGGSPHAKHWRRHLPRTYYITHSLAPVMYITGVTPKRVTAFGSFAPPSEDVPTGDFNGDKTSIILTQNEDGSVFRITGCSALGAHGNSYRIAGTKGQIENLRGMGSQVMLQYNEWQIPEGEQEHRLYKPEWNDPDVDIIVKSGHGGGDYLVARMFLNCIKENKQPEFPFDIYGATTMASVGILSHRSVLEGGKPFEIPDFRNEEDCIKYENDWLSPFYCEDGREPSLPCCSVPDYAPSQEQQNAHWKFISDEGKTAWD